MSESVAWGKRRVPAWSMGHGVSKGCSCAENLQMTYVGGSAELSNP